MRKAKQSQKVNQNRIAKRIDFRCSCLLFATLFASLFASQCASLFAATLRNNNRQKLTTKRLP